MKLLLSKSILFNLLLILLLLLPLPASAQSSNATYMVTFESTWSQQSHPHPDGANKFPAGAHYSPLIGASHNISATFWSEGQLASPGIEQMAETGGTSLLTAEIAAQGGNVLRTISGAGLGTSPGSTTIQSIRVDRSHPLVTLVTMIAPSPDWFVGVAGLSLLDANGNWQDKVVVTLYPYDAGSDDGADYASADIEPTPHHNISNYQGQVPFSNEPVGTFTFTRMRHVYMPVVNKQ